MTNTRVVKVGHSKVSEAVVGGVFVAAYRFDKRRLVYDRQGEISAEVPFSEVLYLVKLPGESRKLWLQPHERRRLLEALQEVDPNDRPIRPVVAEAPSPAGEVQLSLMGSVIGGELA